MTDYPEPYLTNQIKAKEQEKKEAFYLQEMPDGTYIATFKKYTAYGKSAIEAIEKVYALERGSK